MGTKYDEKWFMKRVKEGHPNDYMDYEILSPYKTMHTKMKIKHLVCGNTNLMFAESFVDGRGCMVCGKKKHGVTQRKTPNQLQEYVPSYIHVVGEFTSVLNKTLVHCDHCNRTYPIRLHDLHKNQRCPYCCGTNRETTKSFKEEVDALVGNEYSVLSEYTTANDLIKMRHNICGTEYMVTPHNFKHGRRCPNCIQSRGESTVKRVLTKNNLSFEPQKKFYDLMDKRHLSYDFYLPRYRLLIEYQGEQHYHSQKHFGGNDEFSIQVRHDKIKSVYANENGYFLLKIPYTLKKEKDIKHVIFAFINKISGNRGY